MLDALGNEEAGVNLSALCNVERIGFAVLPCLGLIIVLAVLTSGVVGESCPVFRQHDSIVDRTIGASDLHEASNDTTGGVGKTACVVDEFLSVAFAILEAVLFVHDNRVVGVAYLAAACTKHQLAISGHGEHAVCLVLVFLLSVVIVAVNGDGASEEVGLRLGAGVEGESGNCHVEESCEERELCARLAHVLFLRKQTVEVA